MKPTSLTTSLAVLAIAVLVGCGKGPAADAGPPPEDGGEGPGDAGVDAGTDGGLDAGTRYHPPGWELPDAGIFHGRQAHLGLQACTGCHGADLQGGPVGVSCETCHPGWKTNCTFCHGGGDNSTGAPPRDVEGRTATTERSVGAHSSHVMATAGLSVPHDCADCHLRPTDVFTPGHLDARPAEVSLSGWDGSTTRCSTYCHGQFPGGIGANAPSWTVVNGTQAACGTCHALPPPTGRHPNVFPKHSFMANNCQSCHSDANGTGTAILEPSLHVNGIKDVSPVGGSWDPVTRTCTPGCHEPEQW